MPIYYCFNICVVIMIINCVYIISFGNEKLEYPLLNFLNITESKSSVWILDDLCTKLMMPIKLETKKLFMSL